MMLPHSPRPSSRINIPTWPLAFTLYRHHLMVPSGWMTKVERAQPMYSRP